MSKQFAPSRKPYRTHLSPCLTVYNSTLLSCVCVFFSRYFELLYVTDGYQAMHLAIHVKRKMVFGSYILTIPAVFLSFLTLVVFALPAHDPQKCELGTPPWHWGIGYGSLGGLYASLPGGVGWRSTQHRTG